MSNGRGEYIGKPIGEPKNAMITIPYSDYRRLLEENRRLHQLVVRLSMKDEEEKDHE